jgi:hypothetical protein
LHRSARRAGVRLLRFPGRARRTSRLSKGSRVQKEFGPRGVIHSFAGGKIEDTGPLTKKRREMVDEEATAAALSFMDKAVKDKKPFFVWWNSTRMHLFTHLKPSSVLQARVARS